MNIDSSYQPFEARNMDYGSELTYLSLFHYFFKFDDPLLGSYWIITLAHLIAYALCLNIILIGFKKIPNIVKCSTIVLCLATPLITFHSAFIKPDTNIVLLFLALSIYFLYRYTSSRSITAISIALGCAGAAAAIKWWGVFLFPACIYILQTYPINLKRIGRYLIVFSHGLIAVLALYMIRTAYLTLQTNIDKIPIYFPFFSKEFVQPEYFLLASLITLLVLSIFLMSFFRLFNNNTKPLIINALFCFFAIFSSYVLINVPFLVSVQFPFAVFYYSQQFIFVGNDNHILPNILNWIAFDYKNGVYTITSVLLMSLALFRAAKHWSSPLEIILLLFLSTIVLFLYLLISKINGNQASMYMHFIWLLGFLALYNQIRNYRFRNIIISVIVAFEICYQNSFIPSHVNLPSVFQYYLSFDHVEDEIRSFQQHVDDTSIGYDVFVCEAYVPLENYKKRLRRKECGDPIIVSKLMSSGDVIVTDSEHTEQRYNWIINSDGYKLIGTYSIDSPGRFGNIRARDMKLFRKI